MLIDKDDINYNSFARPADNNEITNVKFGFQVAREFRLITSKYFKQILNYSQIFALDSGYIFFAPPIMQKVQLTNNLNIALKIEAFDSQMLSRKLVCWVQSLSILFGKSSLKIRYAVLWRALKVQQFTGNFFAWTVNNGQTQLFLTLSYSALK